MTPFEHVDAIEAAAKRTLAGRTASASGPVADATLRSVLTAAVQLALDVVAREGEPTDPLACDPEALAVRLRLQLGAQGMDEPRVLARLAEILAATPITSSWRFVNQLFGGREPVALAAELLAAVVNVSMYTFKAAGAQVLVERELIRHMAERLGMPGAEGTFVPGGSIGNLVALLLARDAALPQVRDEGATGRRVAVYASSEAHYSVPKAMAMLGLGRRAVRTVDVDDRGRMRAEKLRACMAADVAAGVLPLAVVATSGTTVRGAFDPLRELGAVAREFGAWLHVDGALGGTLALSPSHRLLLDGVADADSVSWNPHKMMGVPLQSSLLFVRRPRALANSLDQSADYLFQTHVDEFDPGHRSVQCGRRNDAFKLWAAWLRLGDDGWAARIDRQLALARHAARRIAADPVLELIEPPPSVNVCFTVRGIDSAAVCDRLYRSGRLSIGHGQVASHRVIRLVCVNPDLGEQGVDRILDEVRAVARG